MADLFGFYGVTPSQGTRTLSLAFAEMLANEGYKTLYVELNTSNPAIAITNQITDTERNAVEFFQRTVSKNDFSVENYVLNKKILMNTENRELKKVYSRLPETLDFLGFPYKFVENSFPTIVSSEDKNAEKIAEDYILKLTYSLKTSNYNFVILNLPNDINHLFGFNVIENLDMLYTVVTPNATRIYETKNALSILKDNIPGIENKLKVIINQASKEIDIQTNKDLMKDFDVHVIYFDLERQEKELALENSSPIIDEALEQLALMKHIEIEPKGKKSRWSLKRS
ncbi:hypothetical protein P4562_21235 [Lysinibacillus xylanilyticus]|uniref:hypothetical protein n=1 Tax=Lysinibacillus xylanilyticus TaxID=582475 RepID=UPI002E1B5E25|nr:hypothetical protein [Lysinibacillus xylanilyticus]